MNEWRNYVVLLTELNDIQQEMTEATWKTNREANDLLKLKKEAVNCFVSMVHLKEHSNKRMNVQTNKMQHFDWTRMIKRKRNDRILKNKKQRMEKKLW